MALLRIGGINPGKRREELLSNYEGEEPYMPGGYETPYNGQEPYMPDGYDEDYDDEPYDDAYYGDYDEDDGYDASYERPSRYDDDYGYDDAYGYDEDGYPLDDEGYDRAPYYDTPEYEPQIEYPEGGVGDVMRYTDEHDWVTLLLLLLLPPLGIWLLWRRRRYTESVNILLTLLSFIWVGALLVILFIRPFRSRTDTTITPQPVGAAAVVAETPTPEPQQAEPEPVLVPTEEVDEANAVYTVAGSPYYHQGEGCSVIPGGVEINRISRNSAIEQALLACPYCMAGQYSDGIWDLVFVNAQTEDKSNVKVYCSAYNVHFHTDPNCSDMGGDAHEVGLKDALLMAKTNCDICCPGMGMEIYCTVDGTYYHAKEDCSGMRNASRVTVAEARVTGKKRCPTCIGGTDETEDAAAASADPASGYYVYATPNGTYYHVNATCSGMKDAKQVLLSEMLSQKRPACPVCCPDAETTVYAESGNPYYHSYAGCSGMTNARQGILVNALASGLTRCPECWTSAEAQ
ncbi:MAG: hypothetical protein IJ124_03595 [Clostridia bacterium]|nr:hypothetical protein [Clostridia bacterium]